MAKYTESNSPIISDNFDFDAPPRCLVYAAFSCDTLYSSFLEAAGPANGYGPSQSSYPECSSSETNYVNSLVRGFIFRDCAPSQFSVPAKGTAASSNMSSDCSCRQGSSSC